MGSEPSRARFAGAVALVAVSVSASVVAQEDPRERSVLSRLDLERVARDTVRFSESIVDNRSGAGANSAAAGTDDEGRLADAVARDLGALGLHVRRERFPVRRYDYGPVDLRVGGRAIPAITLHSGGGTWGERDAVAYRSGNADSGRRLDVAIVDAGDGYREDYERAGEVAGKAVLVRWGIWPGFLIQEAHQRGASAIVLHDYPGRSLPDARKQNTVIQRDEIAAVHVSVDDAVWIRERLRSGERPLRLSLENRVDSGYAFSENVVGVLAGGDREREWILVGAHHDRWFQGAQDNAVGTAVLLELARFVASWEPGARRRSFAFVSFGSEETGGVEAEYDWLTGSYAFTRAHPEIVGRLAFGLNVDGAGWSSERGFLYGSVELHPFLRELLSDLALDGRVALREGVTNAVDAWTLAAVGGGSVAYLLWFESHGRDSGERPFSPYYHTAFDVYRPELYENLSVDLRLGALALARANAAERVPVSLSALAGWAERKIAESRQRLPSRARSSRWDDAMGSARSLLRSARSLETAKLDSAAADGRVLRARRGLAPWLITMSSTGAVLRVTPHVDDWLALDRSLESFREGGDPRRSSAALEAAGTMSWGSLFSNDTYLAERMRAYAAPDWSRDYLHVPRALPADLHAVYLELARGRATDVLGDRLVAMRAIAAADIDEALFLIAGKLDEARDELERSRP